MTAYASVNDMVERWGKTDLERLLNSTITGTGTDGETPDPYVNVKLDGILSKESNRIDTYLRGAGYAVPLSETPNSVCLACMEMSFFKLWGLIPTRTAPLDVKTAYDDWIQWLRDLMKGLVKLDVITEPTQDTTVAEGARMSNSARSTADIDSFAISPEPEDD